MSGDSYTITLGLTCVAVACFALFALFRLCIDNVERAVDGMLDLGRIRFVGTSVEGGRIIRHATSIDFPHPSMSFDVDRDDADAALPGHSVGVR